jgi:hypothetical protein
MRDDNSSSSNASRHEFFNMAVLTAIFLGLTLLPRLF